jgi:hypothetical protein
MKNELTLAITGKEFAARKKAAKPFKPKETRGVLAKYASHVTSASEVRSRIKIYPDDRINALNFHSSVSPAHACNSKSSSASLKLVLAPIRK